jgi:hypothetical protein
MEEVVDEFNRKFGTSYGALYKEYGCEDAEVIFVATGSSADNLKLMFDNEPGVGFVKLKSLQPFPEEVFQKYNDRDFYTVESSFSWGMNGGRIRDLIAASQTDVKSVIAGVGGRKIRNRDVKELIRRVKDGRELPRYLNADVEAAEIDTMYEPMEMSNKKKLLEKAHSEGVDYPKGRVRVLTPEKQDYYMKSWGRRHKDPSFDSKWLPGSTACPGCTNLIAINVGLDALNGPVAMVSPASCLNVVVGTGRVKSKDGEIYAASSANFPFTNMAFGAGPSATAGVKSAYTVKGIDAHAVCWMGDGGAAIGRASFEDVVNMKSDVVVVVNDNREFQNTGGQASSTTD